MKATAAQPTEGPYPVLHCATEVPEETIKSAGDESMRLHYFKPYDHITRTIIEAAAPAIRKQERERVREEIRERLKVATKELEDTAQTPQEHSLIAVASRLVLASLEDS